MEYVTIHVKNLYGLSPFTLRALKPANAIANMSNRIDDFISLPSLSLKDLCQYRTSH